VVGTKSDITAILFDLDDTLFDHTKAQNDVILRITKVHPELFGNIGDDKIIDAFHKADRMAIEEFNAGVALDVVRSDRSKRFLNFLGINEGFGETINERYIQSYRNAYYPMENAVTIIQRLHGRYKLGIVSNGSSEMQMFKLESLNISDSLDCKIFSEGVGIRKPDPEIFLAAAKALKLTPADCLFVGNSYKDDVIGAKNAGMHTCWFNRNKEPVPSKAVYHDIQISRLEELLGLLAS
jgi:HAD superfamily hydrolase (TIGR01549 family)